MKSKLRILQLIDSLEAGGAERMAVNYANVLVDFIELSALVTTRKQGALKEQLSGEVRYLFLNRKGKIGIGAVLRLRKFVKQHKIDIIHAHSTSFFVAVLVKLLYPRVKIVWHDHHGNRVQKTGITNLVLKYLSFFFDGVLTVNQELEEWSKSNLLTRKVQYFPNFISTHKNAVPLQTRLKGEDAKRIVFLANLKHPKNHLFFLEAFYESEILKDGWSLHLIGRDFEDEYSNNLKALITEKSIEDSVFIYGSCNDIEQILSQGRIGVLASTYEGFPVTLLEYGKSSLAVLSTWVGYCSKIIKDGDNGYTFDPENKIELINKLKKLTSSEDKINVFSEKLNDTVLKNYSDKVIINQYLRWLNPLFKNTNG